MPEVDAEDRHVDFYHVPGHAQEGAVASQGNGRRQLGAAARKGFLTVHFRKLVRQYHDDFVFAAEIQYGFKVTAHFGDVHVGEDPQAYVAHDCFLYLSSAA